MDNCEHIERERKRADAFYKEMPERYKNRVHSKLVEKVSKTADVAGMSKVDDMEAYIGRMLRPNVDNSAKEEFIAARDSFDSFKTKQTD